MNTNNGKELDIIALGTPITKGSYAPYTNSGKAVSVDPRTTAWENKIRAAAIQALRVASLETYDCPIAITGEIRVPRPQTARHTFPAYQTAKNKGGGDLDKLLRTIGDALQEVPSKYIGKRKQGVISDDSRIIHWNITKLYETNNRPQGIYITLTPIETEHDIYTPWEPTSPQTTSYLDRIQRINTRLGALAA